MTEERRYYQSTRRKGDRARERLVATLAQSRSATARDERTDARRVARDAVEAQFGGERNVTRFGERAHKRGTDRRVGVNRDRSTPRTRAATLSRYGRPYVEWGVARGRTHRTAGWSTVDLAEKMPSSVHRSPKRRTMLSAHLRRHLIHATHADRLRRGRRWTR